MILDHRGEPIPALGIGFIPSAPTRAARRHEPPKDGADLEQLAYAAGFYIEAEEEPYEAFEQCQ